MTSEPIKVDVTVRRTDVLRANLYLVPRLSVNYWLLGIFWVVAFTVNLDNFDHLSLAADVLRIIVVTILALVLFAMSFVLGTVFLLSTGLSNFPSIGKHTFEIRDDHFVETTHVSETMTKWKRLQRILQNRNYIFVFITKWYFHLIPKRSFSDDAEFDHFYSELVSRFGKTTK